MRQLDRRIAKAANDIQMAVGASGTTLTELHGLGALTAGKILGHVGDVRRFRSAAAFALFKETPPHSSFDWHNDPIPQYAITLSGVLEFTTVGGETFTIRPGDVLLAVDHIGSGHKWRLINDEPWKRAYVVFKEGADTHFVPDQT